jgi:hypothetical protein
MRNTFIHFDDHLPEDLRVIRSLPHKMFSQFVAEESLCQVVSGNSVGTSLDHTATAPAASAPVQAGCWLTPGAEVCIDGLTKQPAFNGLVGVVEFFDESTNRYTVSFSSPTAVGGRQTAKVRSENLRCLIRAVPCIMLPCSPTSRSPASSPLSTSPSSTRW